MNLFIAATGSILTDMTCSADFISKIKGLTVNIDLFQSANILYSWMIIYTD